MDILDIDEVLKDDSFIFLADKAHDDVSNILQQWKTNNGPMQQQQNDQAYKLNSKTFTRPKRKSAQNLENQFSIITHQNHNLTQQHQQQQQQNQQNSTPMLNLEIGGLVTNMHKSFLQDTSPPSSICSSMEVSMDRMNNSLVTSADFTNLQFLQSTQSLDFNCDDLVNCGFNMMLDKTTTGDIGGYTLSDMIRDRKALESLTMSGDGTLIKDSQIAQIDDISLTLSKTASGCSTMDNSTDSAGDCNNQTMELMSNRINEKTFDGCHNKTVQNNATVIMNTNTTVPATMHHTMVLSGDMIGDITFNLVENSMHCDDLSDLNVTQGMQEAATATVQQATSAIVVNETFKKPAALNLDECTALPNINAAAAAAFAPAATVNTTFDCHDQEQDLTPENVEKKLSALRFCESTPQADSVRYQVYKNNKQYTPTIKMTEDFNISPIVAAPDVGHNATRLIMNNTFEPKRIAPPITSTNTNINTTTTTTTTTSTTTAEQLNSEKMSKTINLPNFSETLEILDNVENPNETYNTKDLDERKLSQVRQQEERQAEDARKQMQNVMDLAEAEVELLAQQNDEEQFEHMLDELGRVELNAEQVKMQKSLDSIKRRFNYSGHGVGLLTASRGERELSREAQDMRDLTQHMNEVMGGEESEETTVTLTNFNTTNELNESLREMALRQSRKDITNELKMSRDLSNSSAIGLATSTSVMSSQGSERLLSRRSRLYDDVNLSTLTNSNGSLYPKTTGSNTTSFDVQKDNTKTIDADMPETETQTMQETEAATCGAADDNASSYKLAEKRERDRDRFKTIKITKQCTDVVVAADGTELNVPCIDDDNTNIDNDNKIKCYNAADQLREQKLRRQETKLIETNTQQSQRISRRDRNTSSEVVEAAATAAAVFNNNKSEVEQSNTPNQRTTATNPNYLTYKKPKDKLTKYNLPDITVPAPSTDQEKEVQPSNRLTQPSRLEPRSLSRPRYISGLQKFNVVNKATSAGDLQKTTTRQSNANMMNASRQQGGSGGALKSTTELKSPMGMKSKSFHNLSSNFGAGSGSGILAPRPSLGYGLRKPNATATSERQSRQITSRYTTSSMGNGTTQSAEKTVDSLFKVPKLVSNLRAPNVTTSGLKRSTVGGGGTGTGGGLARPSSGYYSLNVMAKANSGSSIQQPQATIDSSDNETGGRHSPSESLSSASSRGSLYGGVGVGVSVTKQQQTLANNSSSNSISNGPKTNVIDTNAILGGKLTQVTIGASGIPKPSGLRPPTTAKRSGLPRPSSIVRR